MIYEHLILEKYVRPTALDRWLEAFEIDENDWQAIFTQPYIATRDTKLQSLQYKIIHRIFPCKKWLHTQKVVESPLCTLCDDNKIDDMLHHLAECSALNNLWSYLEKWWNRTVK